MENNKITLRTAFSMMNVIGETLMDFAIDFANMPSHEDIPTITNMCNEATRSIFIDICDLLDIKDVDDSEA